MTAIAPIVLNINSQVRVKLTPFGRNVWGDYWEVAGNREFRIDADGCVLTELHSLMYIFGKHFYMGCLEIPFVHNRIEVVES